MTKVLSAAKLHSHQIGIIISFLKLKFDIAGYPNFTKDICMMIGKKPSLFYTATWLVITPCLLLVRLA